MFFNIDDAEQNLDFSVEISPTWLLRDYEKNFERYLRWYQSFFEGASETQIIGEDSTTYMASRNVPERMAKLLPNVKLIFMLRDPVARVYSNYWHLVKSGHAVYSFENTIRIMPGTILQRSFYRIQIERFRRFFPEKNLKFVIFEDFVERPQEINDDTLHFLGVDKGIDVSNFDAHRNPSFVPRHIGLQIMYNHIMRTRRLVTRRFASHLPSFPQDEPNPFLKRLDKLFLKLSYSQRRKYPPMKKQTRLFLEHLLLRENRGLSDLIGVDLQKFWRYFRE
jgi:hypothetical protein